MKTKITLLILSLSFFSVNSQIRFSRNPIFEEYIFPPEPTEYVYTADIDGDFDEDILYATSSGFKLGWLENDGTGNYGSANPIFITTESYRDFASLDIKDVDNDGDLDIFLLYDTVIYGDPSFKVFWLENDGKGNFIENNIYNPSFGYQGGGHVGSILSESIRGNDLDGDGDIDVVAQTSKYDISWFENIDGEGNSWSAPKHLATDHWIDNIYVHDFDNDGDMDIIKRHKTSSSDKVTNSVGWFENLDGKGTFSSFNVLHTSFNMGKVSHIEIGDMNSDGYNDITLISNYRLMWLKNDNGTFTETSLPAYWCDSAKLLDIDKDNDLDVVYTKSRQSSISIDAGVFWCENIDGNGTFESVSETHQLSSNEFIYSKFRNIAITDVNNDNELDIIAADYQAVIGHSIIRFIKNQDLTFKNEQGASTESSGRLCMPVDIDNDDDLDFLVPAYKNTLVSYENLDSNAKEFSVQKLINKRIFPEEYYVFSYGDINGDNFTDVVLTLRPEIRGISQLYYFLNNQQGSFGPLKKFDNQPNSLSDKAIIKINDIDNDGDNDIFIKSSYYISDFQWFENLDGNGDFSSVKYVSSSFTEPTDKSNFMWLDIDKDNDLDIILCSDQNGVKWIEFENGDYVSEHKLLEYDYQNFAFDLITSGDINNDGWVDIIAVNRQSEHMYYYLNNKNDDQTFWERVRITTENNGYIHSIQSDDIDKDGDDDVLISTTTGLIFVDNINGSGSFKAIKLSGDNFGEIALADINKDGLPDFTTSDSWYDNSGFMANRIEGTVALDIDNNGCAEDDLAMDNVLIETTNGTDSYKTYSYDNGAFQFYLDKYGDYTTSIRNDGDNFNYMPESYSTTFSSYGNTEIQDFCYTAEKEINDLRITVLPITEARPGFDASYRIVYHNAGTTTLGGDVLFEFDGSKLDFLGATKFVNTETNNSLSFSVSLYPMQTKTINVFFNILPPPTNNIEGILTFNATLTADQTDEFEEDNIFELSQVLIGSYDPNDILVLEGDSIYEEEVNDFLHYVIRFQNTGTADAINVRVENELDQNLNWDSFEMLSSSHKNRIEIKNRKNISFHFDNIFLPDSTANEPKSHGFVAYRIKPKLGIEIGDIMANDAEIYFDFNLPIITNKVNTEVFSTLNIKKANISNVRVFPNPVKDILNIKSTTQIKSLNIFNHLGQEVLGNIGKNSINISRLQTGLYFLKIEDNYGNFKTKRFIKD
jgi:uncharacterized repeat protein (TIGR01451 family)